MIKGFTICDRTGGMPSYFSLEVARDFGANHGWTCEPEAALGFARESDAMAFMEKYLPHIAPYATITPQQWEKK